MRYFSWLVQYIAPMLRQFPAKILRDWNFPSFPECEPKRPLFWIFIGPYVPNKYSQNSFFFQTILLWRQPLAVNLLFFFASDKTNRFGQLPKYKHQDNTHKGANSNQPAYSMASVVVKINYKGDIRRFSAPEKSSIEQLQGQIERIYALKGTPFILRYVDDEVSN